MNHTINGQTINEDDLCQMAIANLMVVLNFRGRKFFLGRKVIILQRKQLVVSKWTKKTSRGHKRESNVPNIDFSLIISRVQHRRITS